MNTSHEPYKVCQNSWQCFAKPRHMQSRIGRGLCFYLVYREIWAEICAEEEVMISRMLQEDHHMICFASFDLMD